ncbi:alcohol dehydrogenase catalytic domain-containing protein [Devosia sp. 2618]|uniref:alcohol dehydrogenase catalytic domain-containing protein n=1 Tax=Devosia sp. 2618 TaxID=3156454 RepID=UPI00339B084B
MKRASLIGPRQSRVDNVPLPALGENDVLVRVQMSGICASELHTWEHGANRPLVLGHEVAGNVVAVGSAVAAFSVGDRVTGLFEAGFSDFAVAPAERVLRIPDAVEMDLAFGEPLACAMSAARRTTVELGDRIAVVGMGFMGQLMTKLLALRGAAEIVGIDIREDARAAGLSAGCGLSLSPAEVTQRGLDKFDLVVEGTGTPEGLRSAGELTREHGRLTILGYHQGGDRSVDMQMWNYKALEVVNGHERRVDYRMDCMRRALDLMARGKLDLHGMASHTFSLSQVDDAFAALASKPRGFVKAVVLGDSTLQYSPEIPVF